MSSNQTIDRDEKEGGVGYTGILEAGTYDIQFAPLSLALYFVGRELFFQLRDEFSLYSEESDYYYFAGSFFE